MNDKGNMAFEVVISTLEYPINEGATTIELNDANRAKVSVFIRQFRNSKRPGQIMDPGGIDLGQIAYWEAISGTLSIIKHAGPPTADARRASYDVSVEARNVVFERSRTHDRCTVKSIRMDDVRLR